MRELHKKGEGCKQKRFRGLNKEDSLLSRGQPGGTACLVCCSVVWEMKYFVWGVQGFL